MDCIQCIKVGRYKLIGIFNRRRRGMQSYEEPVRKFPFVVIGIVLSRPLAIALAKASKGYHDGHNQAHYFRAL